MSRKGAARTRDRATLSLLLLALLVGCGDRAATSGGEGTGAAARAARLEDLTPIGREEWVGLIDGLSEPGGFFDTDNLTSNEASYLHVLGPMRRIGVEGGAYVGVGPDQNFAYMAQQRPWIAFIVDLRRDNLVHHLLLKALFHESDTRVEYLALLFGREAPADPAEWEAAPITDILDYLEAAPGGEGTAHADSAKARVMAAAETFGIELGPVERSTLVRFHEAFIREGAEVRFTSFGRAPRAGYPTFGELLSVTDLEGERGSYLARREDFVFLKTMQEANRVVPVVGDLSGRSALRAIGEEVRRRGLTVRAFYTSNVEYYLWSAGTYETFAETLAELPTDNRSVIIRSVFPTTAEHPHAVPGYYSTQTLARLQDVQRVVRGSGYRGYQDLVVRHAIDPRGDGR